MTSLRLLFIFLKFHSYLSVGLYTGVPCHRPYNCIFEDNQDGFDNSLLLASYDNIEREKDCQGQCSNLESCISYTWWNEKSVNVEGGYPFLCQLFSICHRNYWDPDFTSVFSGPAKCKEPIVVFGGDGEDRIDPKPVEIFWPGYDDGYDDSGYVTINDLDPVPSIPELNYGEHWYHSAVQLNSTMILSCGGGYPGTNRCFGLDLVSGMWSEMPPMVFPRTESFKLLKVGNGILAIGGTQYDLIEIFNSDFGIWMAMPQWNGPFDSGLSRHCAVSVDDYRIMVIGGATTQTSNTSKIFDVRTGEWSDTAMFPGPRYAHACVKTVVNGVEGVMVTGGTEGRTDPNDYYPGQQTDFYQLVDDTWVNLANTSFPVMEHVLVTQSGKPMIIGGEYELFQIEVEIDGIHMRDHVQIYENDNSWFCCLPSMNFKRSKFAAVNVVLDEKLTI